MNRKTALKGAVSLSLALGLWAIPGGIPADVLPMGISASQVEAAQARTVVLTGTVQMKAGAQKDWDPGDMATRMKPLGHDFYSLTVDLRFIVVDELHTFDGAQGTDLACLIRRLKSRLNIPDGYLCCVGTSATMGGEGSAQALLDYAQNIFGEIFDKESIVTEDRLTGHEFLDSAEVHGYRMPSEEEARELNLLSQEEDAEGYLEHAVAAWFGEDDCPREYVSDEARTALADKLMHHSFFHSLMGVMDGKIRMPSEIKAQLANVYPEMAGKYAFAIIDSMLALISHARIKDSGGHLRPFLQVQVGAGPEEEGAAQERAARQHHYAAALGRSLVYHVLQRRRDFLHGEGTE